MFVIISRTASLGLTAVSKTTPCRAGAGASVAFAGSVALGKRRPAREPALTRGEQTRQSLCALAGRQTYRSFDEMLSASPEPALVDFYSTTCGPCVLMGRTLDQVASKLKALPCRVMKVDVDKYPDIADRFQIQALPTLILFKDNKELRRLLGYRDGATLEREVRESLAQTSHPI
ncbi:hypothetical protein F1559_001686 [Cyanidiococcus yangmingshanensis]|uniref:Thioredoxin domain-containing protein n=1 Tax=Cyanidiococcus yangmingshanensis TaxID=2690220 RepID=A0A7J7IGD4_9RHOD|nr:hypothetical protein F1559_001686 [Cyanidiococcus yangmingshanensis]